MIKKSSKTQKGDNKWQNAFLYDLRKKQKATAENRSLVATEYECLSNEIKFDGGYKQMTKARQA